MPMNAQDLAVNAPRTPAVAAHNHFVQFYERDTTLVQSVARYLREGLEGGKAAIMIATPVHRSEILQEWQSMGFDASAAGERLVFLDAAQTLERLIVDGWPQANRFEEIVAAAVKDGIARFGGVVAFGEMVALLWAAGRRGAAIRLEGLWNELGARHDFSLYCAYQIRDCGIAEASDDFHAVCMAHSHVIPAEESTGATDADDPQRLIATLQQRTAALEREIETRRRVEGLLADRERELSDFLDNGVYGLHKVGPDGTILWANQAELDMLGLQAHEYIGRNIVEFHVDRMGIAKVLQRLSDGETLRDHAARLICKDGSIRHVLISSNALREEGRLVSTRCFTRDVSDRWLAQEALRERGAMLHLAMQGARMGYWIADMERQSMRCSQELASLFGVSGAFDWSLDAFVALIHPEDRKPFRAALQESIEARHELVCEFRVRREMSDWRWFEGRGEAVYDDEGRAVRFYGVCMDVTARKREQQMLAHLAAIVDSAEDAIVSKTLDGIVLSWNAGAARIFGYEAEEVIGRPITMLIPPELHHEEAQILAQIRAGKRVEHYHTTRVAKDGTRKRVSLAVSPVRDTSGRVVSASKIARLLDD
jgi:PAS domain S-box-containing protein